MTLTGKYNEAIGRVTLSAEARARILENVKHANVRPGDGKIVAFPGWKRWAAMAACLVLIIAGAVSLLPKQPKQGTDAPIAMAPGAPVEYSTLDALSAAAGFPVENMSALPVEIDDTGYLLVAGDLAQVTVRSGDQTITFRKLIGSEDASGDYTVYPREMTADVNGVAVTCKGPDEGIALLLWQKDGFSYALHFTPAAAEDTALACAGSVIGTGT